MAEYVEGFGRPLYRLSDFWIGLEAMHVITSSTPMEARIELIDWDEETRFAYYGKFKIDQNYRLLIRNFDQNRDMKENKGCFKRF